jgi:plastocyanin
MRAARVMMVGAIAAFAACSGGGDGGGGTAPAVFTTLVVAPTTANVLVGGTQTLTVTARDQTGAAMSGLASTFTSGNQAIATVTSGGVVTGVAVGSTTIAVNGTVGTVTKTQNVTVDVTVPGATASVAATTGNQFSPSTVTITRNGVVTWTFATQHNVTFDTQGAPASIPTRDSGTASVTFPSAGTFAYHCTIHAGMNGTVVVQ